MYRIQGISNAYEVDGAFATRKQGQLFRIKPNGKATTALGEGNLLFAPLVEETLENVSNTVNGQMTGIAMCYVEAAATITAGSRVGVGTTGVGVAIYATGYAVGTALATPKGNGDYIPVLLK